MRRSASIVSALVLAWLAPAAQAGQATPDAGALQRQERAIEARFDALRAKLLARSATRADYDQLLDAIQPLSPSQVVTDRQRTLRERWKAKVDELEQRARESLVDEPELGRWQRDLIDLRQDRAFDALAEHALARSATREHWAAVRAALEARAEAAKNDPETGASKQRLLASLAELEERAGRSVPAASDFDAWRDLAISERLERALAELEELALARKATRADFARASDALADRVQAAKDSDPESAAWHAKLQAALDDLRERAARGDVSRDEFKALREKLVSRARKAASGR